MDEYKVPISALHHNTLPQFLRPRLEHHLNAYEKRCAGGSQENQPY